ncbi:MAG: ComF family protein [Ruminococcus sp.]|nr:ComF family protein [Ruminococcus sp.]
MKRIFTKKTKRFLLDLLFPNRCPVCMRVIRWDKVICDECVKEIPFIADGALCSKCGRSHKQGDLCEDGFGYDYVFGAMWYKGKAKKGIYNFKRRYGFNLAELSVPYIYKQLEKCGLLDKVDCITYVPMYRKKEYKRGYNQAERFASILSEAIKAPVVGGMLEHKKSSTQQHELTGSERRDAAKNTYTLGKAGNDKGYKVCILCDDVFTTGSTLDVCSRLLKTAGFETVICASLCVTPKKLADDEYEQDHDSEYYIE